MDLAFLDGSIVSRDDGTYCQVREHFSNNEFADPKNLSEPYNNPLNYYPAPGLPADSVLVVRTSSLHDLEARLSEPDQKVKKPIERRECSTCWVSTAALSELAKIDVSKSSAAAVAIESQTVRMGARIAARTIENHLKVYLRCSGRCAPGDITASMTKSHTPAAHDGTPGCTVSA